MLTSCSRDAECSPGTRPHVSQKFIQTMSQLSHFSDKSKEQNKTKDGLCNIHKCNVCFWEGKCILLSELFLSIPFHLVMCMYAYMCRCLLMQSEITLCLSFLPCSYIMWWENGFSFILKGCLLTYIYFWSACAGYINMYSYHIMWDAWICVVWGIQAHNEGRDDT